MTTDSCSTCGCDDSLLCGTCRHCVASARLKLVEGFCVRNEPEIIVNMERGYCSHHELREDVTDD